MPVNGTRRNGNPSVAMDHSVAVSLFAARAWARVTDGGALVSANRTRGPYRSAAVSGWAALIGSSRRVAGNNRLRTSPVFHVRCTLANPLVTARGNGWPFTSICGFRLQTGMRKWRVRSALRDVVILNVTLSL